MNEVVAITNVVDNLLQEAQTQIEVVAGWDGDDNVQAMLAARALRISVERRESLASAQMLLVARVARDRLWLAHPPTQDFPSGYGNLDDFLVDSGVTGSTLSNLRAIGMIITPFARKNGLNIEHLMTNSNRPKLVYAIPALRATVAEGDVGAFQNVVRDVENFPHREAIGAKYHTPRARRGTGSTLRTPDNRALVILMLSDETYVQDIIQRLAGSIEWGLPMQIDSMAGHKIEVTIYDPKEE